MFADGDFAAKLLLQIRCCRKVVGMRMGFEQPINGQALLCNICDNGIRRRERCSP